MASLEASTSFGSVAGIYDGARPEYPVPAVEWLLKPVATAGTRPSVADVGAGTGKLTRAVLATGADVVSIDPDPDMLATLHTVLPKVPTHIGKAEQLPLAEASVDAVVLGQAWHWVDPTAGAREIGRVVRPGGVLGLIWNIRDDSEEWVRRLDAVIPEGGAMRMMAAGAPPIGAPFAGPEGQVWRWTRPVTRTVLVDTVRSRSSFITASPDTRTTVEADLAHLCDELGLREDATIDMPYLTRAYRARRT